eukprot:scaffold803_cov310-Pinguiococcus_pyrenoidosus.AAC.78
MALRKVRHTGVRTLEVWEDTNENRRKAQVDVPRNSTNFGATSVRYAAQRERGAVPKCIGLGARVPVLPSQTSRLESGEARRTLSSQCSASAFLTRPWDLGGGTRTDCEAEDEKGNDSMGPQVGLLFAISLPRPASLSLVLRSASYGLRSAS